MVSHILGGLLSEAWARSISSYTRSLEAYNARLRDGVQPSTPFINVFDVDQNLVVLCIGNSLYILITMSLFLYMKKREKGFQLRWLLVIYDAFNVILSSYIAVSTLRYKLSSAGLLLCNPIATDTAGYRIAKVFVLFYFQKYVEFIDTWFFLLRKSSRQVTFLHLFHHSSITVVVGSIMPFDYNGDMYLPILLNSLNHALVYLHYLLATLGLQSWWAPYITTMQLAQFIIIFAQSLLSYRIGPTCGSPDFAKVLMIVYMGSMVALFGNFFLQRYILRRPSTDTDMCGVIKRPQTMIISTSQFCGVSKLNAHGSCVVLLPPDFPDPVWASEPHSNCPYAPFTVAYNISAVGAAMPELHVSTEITRFNASLLKGRPATTSANITSSGAAGASNEREGVSGVVASSRSTSTTGQKSGSSSSSTMGLVHRRSGTTAGRDDGSTENHVPVPVSGVQVSGTQRSDDGCTTVSADEYAILRSYWASNINVANSASGMQAIATSGDHDQARFGRSVSTGNLPNTNANSTKSSRFVHNDRLIDGSLTRSVLGGLRKVRSSEKARCGLDDIQGTNPTAICQLDRGETNANNSSSGVDADAVDVSNASNDPTQRRVADLLAGPGGYTYRFLRMLVGFMVGQRWRWYDGEGSIVGLSPCPGDSADSNSISGHRHNSLSLRPMPLCFVVSGGKAGGRVSWMVTVLPSPPLALTQSTGTGTGAEIGNSDDVDASEYEESHGVSQDWRAIFK